MQFAMSSTHAAAIVPLNTKSVRFWPHHDVPELNVMSPGVYQGQRHYSLERVFALENVVQHRSDLARIRVVNKVCRDQTRQALSCLHLRWRKITHCSCRTSLHAAHE